MKYILLFFSVFFFSQSFAADVKFNSDYCLKAMSQFPGTYDREILKTTCAKMTQLPDCKSQIKHYPIFHYDRAGDPKGKNILVFALVHGDETPAGSMARQWIERLDGLKDPRNNWRVVPVVNPEGVENKTRMNGRGIDLNRNLPTVNWDKQAHEFWVKQGGKNARRFPGDVPASEQETLCMIKHIEDFKPNFIVSIHTPYGLLDFDGPIEKISSSQFRNLPWKRLGHFPGSLGRYMWHEKNIPVLTIELKGNEVSVSEPYMSALQDVAGTVAAKVQK